jgi:uracil-DNA glycosylase
VAAAAYLPERLSLPQLREAVQGCRGCDLYRNATQAVFGEGARRAEVMLVGEQPGDKEDLAGRPFVGPAGRLLDEALEEAGIDRAQTYDEASRRTELAAFVDDLRVVAGLL